MTSSGTEWQTIRRLTYEQARQLCERSDARIGREAWDHRACVRLTRIGLTLVVNGAGWPFEPHSIDLLHADWLARVPLADA